MTAEAATSKKASRKTEGGPAAGYLRRVHDLHMGPLWKVMGDLMPSSPRPLEVPYQWKWSSIRPLVYESARMVSVDEAVRRVLVLLNPGIPHEQAACTSTLYAGIQIIQPGEVARAHRHTPNALRFVMEGEGAFTTVSGEKTILRRGDVVTTPNWTWHDHGNEAQGPVVWLDALDIPLVNSVSGMFYEDYPEKVQPVTDPLNSSQKSYGRGLRPVPEARNPAYSPILNYTFASTKNALENLPRESWSPVDGRIVEYVNPLTGGPILPTMDACLQMIDPAMQLRAHRHSSSTILMGVEGEGVLEVEGDSFHWEPYDVMVVPTWAKHRHYNTGSRPTVIFSYSNAPVMKKLSLFREALE